MGFKQLGTLIMMNKKLEMIVRQYKKLSFFQGVILTLCFTSLLSIAATNLPGFFIFNPGTPISSSEINANFEKIAGTVVVKASLISSLSIMNSDFIIPIDCPTCNNYRKKINFDNILINDNNFKTATDNDPNSSSHMNNFTYYEVPTSGWYEIRFVPDLKLTYINSLCLAPQCSHSIYAAISISIAKDLISTSSNSYAQATSYFGVSKYESDVNNDGAFELNSNYYPPQPPEIKRIYLKGGQILFAKLEANYQQTNVTADYTVDLTANSLQLEIIKL